MEDKDIRTIKSAIGRALRQNIAMPEVRRLILVELLGEFTQEANAEIEQQINREEGENRNAESA